jgi:hypothetical protein
VVQGVLTVVLPGAGSFAQGAGIGGLADYAMQKILDPSKASNNWELGTAAASNGVVSKYFGFAKLGSNWLEQVVGNMSAWPITTTATAIGQALGTPSATTPMTGGFGDTPNMGTFAGGAAGGFLLYPNKPNTNQMQSVYAK